MLHQSYRLTLLRFVQKRRKKHLFCAFTLICLITNTEPKISVFVRSHCSGFVKFIVGYYSVFKNLRFCAFKLIKCIFKNLRFCGYPLLIAFSKTSVLWRFCADQCENFHKNGCFSLCFCTKTEQCERGIDVENYQKKYLHKRLSHLPFHLMFAEKFDVLMSLIAECLCL